MPTPLHRKRKPEALELFTDRVEEQQMLHEILGPAPTCELGPQHLLTVFYGVGGVGKTTLCRHVMAEAGKLFADRVKLVLVNFDDARWNPGKSFPEVTGEICRCLKEQGIPSNLSLALLTVQAQQAGTDVPGGVDARWSLALDALDKGVEFSGVPGLALLVKGSLFLRDRAHRHATRAKLDELGLWPEEIGGRLNAVDLERKLARALCHDVLAWLAEGPERQVRMLIDGFERLQGIERREDAQMRLQEFIGYFSSGENPAVRERCRFVVYGREKLRWDELYQDEGWGSCWTQHLLGGLAEADARDFLKRMRAWLSEHGQANLAASLAAHEGDILRAADEGAGSTRVFYPFYLDLAVNLLERALQAGEEPDMGRAPVELQDRFFRYLDPGELRALKILALSEVFDEALFDWLARERLIDYPVHSFHTALRQGHSYIVPVAGRPGEWRLHRLMEEALHARWMVSEAERNEGRLIVRRLLDYYGQARADKPLADWTDEDIEAWRRGMEILVTQGYERGLLQAEDLDDLLSVEPWTTEHHRCVEMAIGFMERILSAAERDCGPDDSETLACAGALGLLLSKKGNMVGAEALLRRSMEGTERLLGPDDPDTLLRVNNLCGHWMEMGRFDDAEVLLRRVLGESENQLGPEDELTLAIMGNLADVLRCKADWKGAENLYRRVFEAQERLTGSDAPDTLLCANNLGLVLKEQGDLAGAESLFRRTLQGNEKVQGADHPTTLVAAGNLGMVLRDRGDLDGAEPLLRRAFEGSEKLLGPNHPATLIAAGNLGVVLRDGGQVADAEPLLRHALDGNELALGPDHPMTITAASNLGLLLTDIGDLDGAHVLLRRAAEGNDRHLGPDHPLTILVRYNLETVLALQGHLEEAEPLLRETREKSVRVLGPKHPTTLALDVTLGELLQKLDCASSECRGSFQDVVSRCEEVLGPHHPTTLKALASLASLLESEGDLAAAEPVARDVLRRRGKTLGADHPDTLDWMVFVSRILEDKGDPQGAEELLLSAMEGHKNVLGASHADTLACADCYAWYLQRQGRLGEAQKVFRRSLRTREKVLGPDHPDTVSTLRSMAYGLSDMHEPRGAAKLMRRVAASTAKSLGPDDPQALADSNALGLFLDARGEVEEAESLFRQVLKTREIKLGLEHEDTLVSANNLGRLLLAQQQVAEAEVLLRRVHEARQKILGPRHPDTLSSAKVVADLLEVKGDEQKAAELYEEVLIACQESLGWGHEQTVAALFSLCPHLLRRKDFAKGRDILRSCMDSSEEMQKDFRHELACCECGLGNLGAARKLIAEEVATVMWARKRALEDPLLAALHDYIATLPEPT